MATLLLKKENDDNEEGKAEQRFTTINLAPDLTPEEDAKYFRFFRVSYEQCRRDALRCAVGHVARTQGIKLKTGVARIAFARIVTETQIGEAGLDGGMFKVAFEGYAVELARRSEWKGGSESEDGGWDESEDDSGDEDEGWEGDESGDEDEDEDESVDEDEDEEKAEEEEDELAHASATEFADMLLWPMFTAKRYAWEPAFPIIYGKTLVEMAEIARQSLHEIMSGVRP